MTATTEHDHQHPEPLTIRAAAREDCGLILQFITELAEYEKLAHEVTATCDDIERTLFGDSPSANVLIAEWGAQPAGFALYFNNYSTFLARSGIYLEDLFVRPDFRGRGIGLALLKRLASLVLEQGGGRLDWWVLDWNQPAIDFYERVGARGLKEWMPMRLDGKALRDFAKNR